MNERIKELAEQAMVTIPAAEGPLSHTYFDREKFAELIIKESISVMQQHDYHGEWLGEKLKEHFGVEE